MDSHFWAGTGRDAQAVKQLSSSMYRKKQKKLADRESGLKSENRRKRRYKTISPEKKPEMAALASVNLGGPAAFFAFGFCEINCIFIINFFFLQNY